MSITKSYNKHTDTYYAYDTTYVLDEKTGKRVQKKVCIGQFDPETGEIIPNARRGRPSQKKTVTSRPDVEKDNSVRKAAFHRELSSVIEEIDAIEASINNCDARLRILKDRMLSLRRSVSD